MAEELQAAMVEWLNQSTVQSEWHDTIYFEHQDADWLTT
jgi:hypothetical protein